MFARFLRHNWSVLLVGAIVSGAFVIFAHKYDAAANHRVDALARNTARSLARLESQICRATRGNVQGSRKFRVFLFRLADRADERARIDLRAGPKTLAESDLDSARLYRSVARSTGRSAPIGCG